MPFVPLSIPSPPEDWKVALTIPIGEWLHGLIPLIPAGQIIEVRSYALLILIGIVLATIWVNERLKARGVESGVVLDVIIWAVPLGLVGARFWHVVTHLGDFFYEGADPWNVSNINSVWAIWGGGNAIFGSLIGGAIGAYIGCRLAGIRFWTFADALAPAMLLAQAVGRLGNYFNQELFGQPTDLPWGLQIDANNVAFPIGLPADTLFHPTFLYEMIWNVVGIVFLLAMERKFRLQWGKVWALYMIWYGVGRFFFEAIRVDPSDIIFGLRSNQWGAIAAVVLGIMLFLVQRRRHPGAEPSAYLPGREFKPEGAVELGQTYSDTDEPGDAASEVTEKHATSGAGTTSS